MPFSVVSRRRPVHRRIVATVACVAAFVLLAANAVVSHITLNNLVAANHLVSESEQTIKLLGDLRSTVERTS